VDRVVLEPSADTPERIRIEGTFVRLEDVGSSLIGTCDPG
jgi:hypothetical protein